MLCHLAPLLGVFFPFATVLIPYLIWHFQRDLHPFVEKNAREVLNFQISLLIYFVFTSLLSVPLSNPVLLESLRHLTLLPIHNMIGFCILAFVVVAFVCALYGAVQASRGIVFWYPLNLRLIK